MSKVNKSLLLWTELRAPVQTKRSTRVNEDALIEALGTILESQMERRFLPTTTRQEHTAQFDQILAALERVKNTYRH
jgi:hypothetical protein